MAANILLIEGPKKSGKTTLSNLLQRQGFSYFKDNTFYNIKDNSETVQNEVLGKNLEITTNFAKALTDKTNLILDRHHITDYVFNYLYRGGDTDMNFSSVQERLVELRAKMEENDMILSNMNSVLIMMTDNPHNLKERDDRDYLNILQEREMFDIAFDKSKMVKFKLNMSDKNFNSNVESIIKKYFNKTVNLGGINNEQ